MVAGIHRVLGVVERMFTPACWMVVSNNIVRKGLAFDRIPLGLICRILLHVRKAFLHISALELQCSTAPRAEKNTIRRLVLCVIIP